MLPSGRGVVSLGLLDSVGCPDVYESLWSLRSPQSTIQDPIDGGTQVRAVVLREAVNMFKLQKNQARARGGRP